MAEALEPGQVLRDKWRIDRFLGEGGMSRVYAATHRNGIRAAIKVLHPELSMDKVLRGRFLREGYVANKVDHPGVVRVLDDDATEDGLVFLVMELLEGVTLKKRWVDDERQMDVAAVLDVVEQVLDVLESAHGHGIVHRDLKPDNIFLLEDGTAKVLDFGIARVLEATMEGNLSATKSTAMMGTPAFMPPEQALAHWDRVDGRTDLFAIAATAYTVLSGRLIHTGSTVPELLVAAATRAVRPIRTVMPDLDEVLASVLDRALRFDIEDRWPDARMMRRALVEARSRVVTTRTVALAVPRELLSSTLQGGRYDEETTSAATSSGGSAAFAETVAYDPEPSTSAGLPVESTRVPLAAPLSFGASQGASMPDAPATTGGLQASMRLEDVAALANATDGGAARPKGRAPWAWIGLGAGAVAMAMAAWWIGAPGASTDASSPSTTSASDAPVVTPIAPAGTAPADPESPTPTGTEVSAVPPASPSGVASAVPSASADTSAHPRIPRPSRPKPSSRATPPAPCKRDPMTRKCVGQ